MICSVVPERSTARSAAAAALAAALALGNGGCASRVAGSPFVSKAGAGPVDVGGTTGAPSIDVADFEQARREALAARAAARPATPSSIEGVDALLKAALASLREGPTVAAYLRVAEEYRRVGVTDLALDNITEALRLDRRSPAAFDARARLYRDAGLLGLSVGDAHRARFFAPRSAAVRNTLGTILERQGLCREALGEYREAVRLEPESPWAVSNAARLTTTCP